MFIAACSAFHYFIGARKFSPASHFTDVETRAQRGEVVCQCFPLAKIKEKVVHIVIVCNFLNRQENIVMM